MKTAIRTAFFAPLIIYGLISMLYISQAAEKLVFVRIFSIFLILIFSIGIFLGLCWFNEPIGFIIIPRNQDPYLAIIRKKSALGEYSKTPTMRMPAKTMDEAMTMLLNEDIPSENIKIIGWWDKMASGI